MRKIYNSLIKISAFALILCIASLTLSDTDLSAQNIFQGTNSNEWKMVANLNIACKNCKLRCKYANYVGGYCACIIDTCDLECDSFPECPSSQDMVQCMMGCNGKSACNICCIESAKNASSDNCKTCYSVYALCFNLSSPTCEMDFINCRYQNDCPGTFFTHNCDKL